ncbi:EamA family transporter, partial [Klebsiella aerogenes]|nr:EamA family transporter [Klebsiella aerogenes]
ALFGSRRPLAFVWVALAVLGLWFLLPLGQNVGEVDLVGALFALGAGAFWAVYILTGQRAGEEHGPATVAMGSLIAAVIFVPIGVVQASDTLLQWSLLPLGLGIAILSTALPYSLEMIALTRMPTRTFGTLMSMEPALAALSGMVFLGETLTLTQTLALGAIIIASMGSTLTMQRQSKIEKVDIN